VPGTLLASVDHGIAVEGMGHGVSFSDLGLGLDRSDRVPLVEGWVGIGRQSSAGPGVRRVDPPAGCQLPSRQAPIWGLPDHGLPEAWLASWLDDDGRDDGVEVQGRSGKENAPDVRPGREVRDGMGQSSSHHSRTALTKMAAASGMGFMGSSRYGKGQLG